MKARIHDLARRFSDSIPLPPPRHRRSLAAIGLAVGLVIPLSASAGASYTPAGQRPARLPEPEPADPRPASVTCWAG